jgi:GT2 family glycosyltransferase
LKDRFRKALGIKPKPKRRRRAARGGSAGILGFHPVAVSLRNIDPKSVIFSPPAGRPIVSIIIPSYGQVKHTLNCLASLAEAPPRCAYEILVVEDASGDRQILKLREVEGIRLIENERNLGFLFSCNSAASQALGEYLYFLNNDTIVEKGAIDDLVAFAEARPDAGLVGSRLLFADGYQQEAGGIVWADGSAWNYGRSDDPLKPEYNYVREADYISGAAILTPRAVWDRLGGFDSFFAPAYCEDTDYAFRVRGLGLKVYYLPTSRVYHFEGVSHGTDTGKGIKAYQVVNLQKLATRYKETLEQDHFPNAQRVMRARDKARRKRILLMIDHYTPEPDRDAGSRSMIEIIRTLQSMNYVVKFWPENLNYEPIYVPRLQRMGVEVLYAPYILSLEEWLAANGAEIDVTLISRPRVAQYALDDVRKGTKAPIVYYGHDLHYKRQQREAEVMNRPEKAAGARKLFELERSLWRETDSTLYPAQEEADEVRAFEPGVEAFAINAYCFENFVKRTVATSGANVLFVAGFGHPPNVDAALWVASEIFPLVKKRRPDATLSLVGSNPTAEVLALASDEIEVTGWVSSEELKARYSRARVAAVPLRFGAGVKLKVVEAMVEAVPLVTTPVGAQGLPALDQVASVKESPEDVAEAILRWLNASDEAWLQASDALGHYVQARYSRAKMRECLETAIGAAEAVYAKRGVATEAVAEAS